MFPDPPTMIVPLRTDEHGAIRVSGTRVTLDVVIARYHQGYSPEAIHKAFSTVSVNDIYAVISYYLAHRDELDAYLKRRDEEAERIRQEIEANYTPEQKARHERLRRLVEEKRRQQNS
ncbi:MAG: DUF433 domain-containing protein [Anaerolineae bacterium]|nr:DUF433 domain-containing protein [Anaerolineae bacterium]